MSSPSDDVTAREGRLERLLGGARRGSRHALTERSLFTIGGALAVAGVVLIIIGWVGTSQTILVAGQIPYVVSGGLLGLALVFLGGFLYFGHWLALLVREGRERGDVAHQDAAGIQAGLAQVSHSLLELSAALQAGGAAAAIAGDTHRLVRTPSGSMVHRPDCPAVAGRHDLSEVAAATNGLKHCAICSPV